MESSLNVKFKKQLQVEMKIWNNTTNTEVEQDLLLPEGIVFHCHDKVMYLSVDINEIRRVSMPMTIAPGSTIPLPSSITTTINAADDKVSYTYYPKQPIVAPIAAVSDLDFGIDDTDDNDDDNEIITSPPQIITISLLKQYTMPELTRLLRDFISLESKLLFEKNTHVFIKEFIEYLGGPNNVTDEKFMLAQPANVIKQFELVRARNH